MAGESPPVTEQVVTERAPARETPSEPLQVAAPPRTPRASTLEPVHRDGLGRIVAWTRDDQKVHTPLVLARDPEQANQHGFGVRLGEHGLTPTVDVGESTPVVQVLGGFHAAPDGGREGFVTEGVHDLLDMLGPDTASSAAAATDPVWSRLVVDRARRIEGLLALRRGGAPVSAHVLAEDDPDDGDRGTTPGLPEVTPVLSDDGAVAMWPEAASAASDPAMFVPRLVEARTRAGPGALLYAPGIGLPHELALLVYAGIDILDTTAVERATLDGMYLTIDGAFSAAGLKAPLCGCTTCRSTAPAEMDTEALRAHNLHALAEELRVVVGHMRSGTLRERVEARVRARPETTSALRHLDAHAGELVAAHVPLTRSGTLHATTMESLARPDIARFRERLAHQYRPPAGADVLLLLPCSARKPYARSRSHRVFKRVLGDVHGAARVHEVMITSPLGVVPRELEHTWPAAHYDVPVTGDWDAVERNMIRDALAALLARGGYKHVISHLGPATHALVADLLPDGAVHTGAPHPTRYEAKDKLRAALRKSADTGNTLPWPHRRVADLHAIARWQYGTKAADALFAKVDDAGGRPPALRAFMGGKKGTQLCAFVPDKGTLVLTMDGARVLHEAGCLKAVEIDDFVPRGTVFAVGVKGADPTIVLGEEVGLVHDGELRGMGITVATGPEMTAYGRGPCVEVRHHA